jgi:hypothetical protein
VSRLDFVLRNAIPSHPFESSLTSTHADGATAAQFIRQFKGQTLLAAKSGQ